MIELREPAVQPCTNAEADRCKEVADNLRARGPLNIHADDNAVLTMDGDPQVPRGVEDVLLAHRRLGEVPVVLSDHVSRRWVGAQLAGLHLLKETDALAHDGPPLPHAAMDSVLYIEGGIEH